MSSSEAKKKRRHHQRQGHTPAEMFRHDWHGVLPVTRKTPSKTEKQRREDHKIRQRNRSYTYEDGSIYFSRCL